ncbi:MAG: 30S ribosomal protein S20 [Patescibacteria group bacterium]|mgnify:FL=1
MPIKKSAKKALRQTIKRTAANRKVKDAIRKVQNDLAKKIAAKSKTEAREMLAKLAQIVDKAAKNNVLAKNKAGRIKSRFQKSVSKIS